MATPLTKPIHRAVEIGGRTFIASIVPSDGDTPPSFTLRRQRYKEANSIPISNLLDKPLDDDPIEGMDEMISKLNPDHTPDNALYIDEATLKMWAKYAHAKFANALKRYKKVTASGKAAWIVWGSDGSITFEPYDLS